MMWGMSANHESANPAIHTETAHPRASISVLVLTNERAHARVIEQAIARDDHRSFVVTYRSLRAGYEHGDEGAVDLLVIDAMAPTMDPLHELKRIRNQAPDLPVMLLHANGDALVASRALRAGATAFLAAHEVSTLLATALETAAAGERFVSEDVMQGILHGMAEPAEDETRIPIEVLSDREMMVFQLLGKGKCPRNIADELGVNIKTVATHCNNIRRKLHTPDNRQLTRISHDWAQSRSTFTPGESTYHHRHHV